MSESLRKCHQSKAMLFSDRNCIQFFFSTSKKYFWGGDEKKSQKNVWEKFSKKRRFFFESEILHEKNLKMYDEKKSQKKSKYFRRFFFSELNFFFRYSFDAEILDLSIGGIFRAIRVGKVLQLLSGKKKRFFSSTYVTCAQSSFKCRVYRLGFWKFSTFKV